MKELDVVKLKTDFQNISCGTIGTVVLEYDKKNVEVEFVDANGNTIDVVTTPVNILEPISAS